MSQKTRNIIGWALTTLLALPFITTGFMKLMLTATALEQATILGIRPEIFRVMGLIEIIATILFIVSRTGVVGALLLVAYTGGIISAHVIHQQPVFAGIIMQVLVWIIAAIRFPELTHRLFYGNEKRDKAKSISQ